MIGCGELPFFSLLICIWIKPSTTLNNWPFIPLWKLSPGSYPLESDLS
jgi:hypothetical protein